MNSEFIDILKVAISTIVIVVGWIVAHYYTNRRDRIAKRREISLEHLINAYRILTDEISHRENIDQRKLEAIITDVQLFGSEMQINLAKQLADDAARNKHFELDPLIKCLRNDLREELMLSKIDGNVRWLRFTGGSIIISDTKK